MFLLTLSGPSSFRLKNKSFFFMNCYSKESVYVREISLELSFFFLFFFNSQMTEIFPRTMKISKKKKKKKKNEAKYEIFLLRL